MTRVYGSTGQGNFGVPVCGGHDCNGDGFRDFAFAQLVADPLQRTNAGMVTLLFGNGQIGAAINTVGFTNSILKIIGDQPYETTGTEIWMDDITGDGIGDLLIGRQNHSPDTNAPGAGALTILVGSSNLTAYAQALSYFDLRNPPTNVAVITIHGAAAYDRLGIWFRTGDIDGDGISDFVVGADERDEPNSSISENSGALYVFRGGAHWNSGLTNVNLAEFGQPSFPAALKTNVALILPPANSANAHFGATCQVADLDGNGRAEVFVAATLNRAGAGLRLPNAPAGTGVATGGFIRGSLFIIWDENFPAFGWPEGYQFRADQPPIGQFTRINGGLNDFNFGEEILAGRDYSGDGFADLFVGDLTGTSPNGGAAGLGYVFWNASLLRGLSFGIAVPPANINFTTIHGPAGGAIGADTVADGDFDNDGIADLAVGNPHDTPKGRLSAGTVHIFFGQPGGWPAVIDLKNDSRVGFGLPPAAQMRITQIDAANGLVGGNGPDTLCYSAASGDINGDGVDDLIINEMIGDGISPGTVDVGNLLIFNGPSLATPRSPSLGSLPPALSFSSRGSTDANSAAKILIISNASPSSITITNLGLEQANTNAFMITSDSGETTLASGMTRNLMIQFGGVNVGLQTDNLRVDQSGGALPLRIGLAGAAYDSAVRPTVSGGGLSNAPFVVRFSSQRGLRYDLERSTNLNSWSAIRTNLTGTGGPVAPERVLPDGPSQFFRVRKIP